jgi:hypothetical protein
LGITVTNQDLIDKEIKSRLNLGKACYDCCLFSENIKFHTQNYDFAVVLSDIKGKA